MGIQPKSFDNQPVEVPRQKVGQIEGAELSFLELCKVRPAGEELVAVGAGQAFHA